MSQSRGRSVVVGRTVQQVREIDLDALVRRAGEVHATLAAHHCGDVVGVAAEVQRLGFGIERVQQR